MRRTDLAAGTFYNYFPDKEAVFRALVHEVGGGGAAPRARRPPGRPHAARVRRGRLPRLLRLHRRGRGARRLPVAQRRRDPRDVRGVRGAGRASASWPRTCARRSTAARCRRSTSTTARGRWSRSGSSSASGSWSATRPTSRARRASRPSCSSAGSCEPLAPSLSGRRSRARSTASGSSLSSPDPHRRARGVLAGVEPVDPDAREAELGGGDDVVEPRLRRVDPAAAVALGALGERAPVAGVGLVGADLLGGDGEVEGDRHALERGGEQVVVAVGEDREAPAVLAQRAEGGPDVVEDRQLVPVVDERGLEPGGSSMPSRSAARRSVSVSTSR